MMSLPSKKWKYVYEDNVIVTEDILNGKLTLCRTAEHHPGNISAPIQYLYNGMCYIYSDYPISGMRQVDIDKVAHSIKDKSMPEE